MMRDLEWLGLGWDGEPVFQSSRHALYQEALELLSKLSFDEISDIISTGFNDSKPCSTTAGNEAATSEATPLIYPCFCSRADIRAASRHPHVRAGIPTIVVDNHIVAHTAAVLLRTYRRERRQGRRLGEHDIEIAIAVHRRFENRACAPIHVRCSEYETRHSKNLRLIRLHHW